MNGLLKPWLVLALIFVAGGLSGSALTMALLPHFMRPPGPAQMQRHIMMRLTRELNLTSDQQAKIKPMVEGATKDLETVHRDEMQRVTMIMKRIDDQITNILTPEQNSELRKMEEERENSFTGRMKSWGPPGDAHFHGEPGEDNGPPPGPAGEPPSPPPASPPPTPAPIQNHH